MKWLGSIFLVVALAARADEGKAGAGFRSLFNGKDLSGWRYPGKKGKPLDAVTATPDRRFEVKDGAIVANAKDSAGKGGVKDLYTADDFNKDFQVKLEFRAAPKSDSGVYIRGPQLQVRDFLRRNEEKSLAGTFKTDDWNELDITVKGTTATIRFNGRQWKTMKVPAEGGVGLQAESGKFEFRKVRIKTLD
jgi:hypothetical protein